MRSLPEKINNFFRRRRYLKIGVLWKWLCYAFIELEMLISKSRRGAVLMNFKVENRLHFVCRRFFLCPLLSVNRQLINSCMSSHSRACPRTPYWNSTKQGLRKKQRYQQDVSTRTVRDNKQTLQYYALGIRGSNLKTWHHDGSETLAPIYANEVLLKTGISYNEIQS